MEKTINRNNSVIQTRADVKEHVLTLSKAGKSEQEIISWIEVAFNKQTVLFELFESVSDLAEYLNIPVWKFHLA